MSIGLAIGHDWEYEKMQERDAKFESSLNNLLNNLEDDYRNGLFDNIDHLMDDVLENIYDDFLRTMRFERLVFGAFLYSRKEVDFRKENIALCNMIGDEIEKVLRKRFNNIKSEYE